MPTIESLWGKVKYSKKERKASKKRKDLWNKKKLGLNTDQILTGTQQKKEVRKELYDRYKKTPSYNKELNMMKMMYKNPKPMMDTKIKTKIKPARLKPMQNVNIKTNIKPANMDNFMKDYNVFKAGPGGVSATGKKPKKKVSFKTKAGKEVSF